MLFETTQIQADPDTIDFGIGQPQLELLPRELMWKASQAILSETENTSLNYGHPKGDGRLRVALASFLAPSYRSVIDPGSFVTTGGASQALNLIAQVFAKPGDTILVEEPTYFLAHRIFRDRGLKVVGVPLTEEGLDLGALEAAAKKHKPAFFYTIPVHQNPTGLTMGAERRRAVLDLAKKNGFLLVADEVYQLLTYVGAPPKPFAAYLESEVVLSVGSFSKILAPGLRLGWIQTSPALQERILEYGLFKSGGGLNHYVSCLVGAALANGWHAEFTESIRRAYAHRVEVMDRCLRAHLGDMVQYRKPEGGYFFWLELPKGIDCEEMQARAAEQKTGFRAGTRFSTQGGMKNYLRLSFAHYSEENIDVGIGRLAKVIKDWR
jgi:2-aminoadipate transaminase